MRSVPTLSQYLVSQCLCWYGAWFVYQQLSRCGMCKYLYCQLISDAAQVIRRGTEDSVREWLELLEEEKGEQSSHSGDHVAIINHAVQVAVRANRPKITKLLLDQGAGDQWQLLSIYVCTYLLFIQNANIPVPLISKFPDYRELNLVVMIVCIYHTMLNQPNISYSHMYIWQSAVNTIQTLTAHCYFLWCIVLFRFYLSLLSLGCHKCY